jgi:pimeloyl-ACP methyl ester carboxylesterase
VAGVAKPLGLDHFQRDQAQVFVGGADELLDAERLGVEFQSQRSDVPVFILPGLGHTDMLTRPDAIRLIVAAFA